MLMKFANEKQKARSLALKLAEKYQESLTYYASLQPSLQNSLQYPIIKDIESYRSLLLVIQENNDTELYEKQREIFNRHNQKLSRFGCKNQ